MSFSRRGTSGRLRGGSLNCVSAGRAAVTRFHGRPASVLARGGRRGRRTRSKSKCEFEVGPPVIVVEPNVVALPASPLSSEVSARAGARARRHPLAPIGPAHRLSDPPGRRRRLRPSSRHRRRRSRLRRASLATAPSLADREQLTSAVHRRPRAIDSTRGTMRACRGRDRHRRGAPPLAARPESAAAKPSGASRHRPRRTCLRRTPRRPHRPPLPWSRPERHLRRRFARARSRSPEARPARFNDASAVCSRRRSVPRARKSSDSTAPSDTPSATASSLVGEPGELAQHDRITLLIRKRLNLLPEVRGVHARRRLPMDIGAAVFEFVLESRKRLAHAVANPPQAFVARDRSEPSLRLARLRPVPQRAKRGQEGLLRSVFRLVTVAQQRAADALHLPRCAEKSSSTRARATSVSRRPAWNCSNGSGLVVAAASRRDGRRDRLLCAAGHR